MRDGKLVQQSLHIRVYITKSAYIFLL